MYQYEYGEGVDSGALGASSVHAGVGGGEYDPEYRIQNETFHYIAFERRAATVTLRL